MSVWLVVVLNFLTFCTAWLVGSGYVNIDIDITFTLELHIHYISFTYIRI